MYENSATKKDQDMHVLQQLEEVAVDISENPLSLLSKVLDISV